jgi:cell wall-associated NlpC family hydrolase
VLQGRTTYAMSGEVPVAERIPYAKLQPADVIFFGAAGPKSKPKQVDHAGIYLGNGWFINSSGYGVAVTTLAGWYGKRFAWARRPLAEAGLVSPG